MIEIAIDGNLDNNFLGKERTTFVVDGFVGTSFDDYRKEASSFIKYFANQKIVVVRPKQTDFSINLFAVALFVESFFINHNIDCVVFKVENAVDAIAKYKPFVALTIGIKYAFTICNSSPKRIYTEFSELGYLGFDIKRDYVKGTTNIKLNNGGELQKMEITTLHDAVVIISAMKALSLAKKPVNIEVEIIPEKDPAPLDKKELAGQILEYAKQWIS